MANIRPFRGVRYNPARVPDLAAVVTQPYDRIEHGLQDKYYAQSAYNATRLVKAYEKPDDGKDDNVYTRAHDYYRLWLTEKALVREEVPALYVLQQTFSLPDGSTRTRQGLMTALELTRFDEGVVLPHERTLSGPKVDRLNLMRATAVHFEHIFMLYPGNDIDPILAPVLEKQKPVELRELYEHDVLQRFWTVTDPAVVAAVVEAMAPKRNLIIADGHHRYETTLNYRDEMRAQYPDAPKNAGFNYRLVTMVSMADPGLVILPTHRLIHSYGRMKAPEVLEKARQYFDVARVADRPAMEVLLARADAQHPRFGFYSGSGNENVERTNEIRPNDVGKATSRPLSERLYDGTYAVLTLRDPAVLAQLLPEHSADWCLLDVSVLHELFIERVLGIDKGAVERKENIDYLRVAQLGYDAVDQGQAEFLLLLNSTRMEQVQACTEAGDKMPQKSTDFYPKVITGLVFLPVGAEERL